MSGQTKQSDPKRYLGLDVGGTQVKAGVFDTDGTRAAGKPQDTQLASADAFLDALAAQAQTYGHVDGVGLGMPGVFRTGTGVLQRSSNLEVLEGVDLIGGLAERLGCSPAAIAVGNDANLAAFGEQGFGAGVGIDDLVMVTLGTGVGGGIVLGGRLVTGPGGKAGEIGHVVVRPKDGGGPPCKCGSFGCLEVLASANAAAERASAANLTGTLKEVCERARLAPGPERDLLHAIGRDLGSGLAYAVTLLDIDLFLVGGGLGESLDVLLPGALETLAERSYGNDTPRLIPAQLGNDAGWIGAARMAATRA